MRLQGKKCAIDGCEKKGFCRNLCSMHYNRWRRHKPVEGRTIYTPNEFVIEENDCKIYLYDFHGEYKGFAIIDASDADKCRGHKWSLGANGYIECTSERLFLHRVILGLGKEDREYVDHINHNKCDNRRENLRFCSCSQNQYNQKVRITSKTGYKGVCWDSGRGKFMANIQANLKNKYLGHFDNADMAALAYNAAAEKLHGEFALLNFISSPGAQ